ncbi:hypothetical protein KKF91_18000 [Myxococcota bacterium]|nr:hypothetical protein [Myxococcota bacterium]MBU1432435.1 hypothetical protein [Myxococcota bacterium]MBU1899053.1 hypothetical protein [Myxococcota bacterium]
MRRGLRWIFLALALLSSGPACNPADIQETTRAYYGDLPEDEISIKAQEMSRVMPFYVVGASLAFFLMGVTILNALEHAKRDGQAESVRFGAWLLLLCFLSLFAAMSVRKHWLPAGYPGPAFLVTATLGVISTALAARKPDRAVLMVGYVSAGLTLPLIGVLFSGEVYLIDTTASLFIGFASGMLITVVFSDPVRLGLVSFMNRQKKV